MGQIGRNDPCPCGSGNKYKKCCLGTQRDPAPSRPRDEGPIPISSILADFQSTLEEVLIAAQSVLGRRETARSLATLKAELGLPAWAQIGAQANDLLARYLVFGREVLVASQPRLRDALLHEIESTGARDIYEQMIASSLRVWDGIQGILSRRGESASVVPSFGAGSREPIGVCQNFMLRGVKGNGGLLGWVLTFRQIRFFFAIGTLNKLGLRRLKAMAGEGRRQPAEAYWSSISRDLLCAAADPGGLLRSAKVQAPSPASITEADILQKLVALHKESLPGDVARDLDSAWLQPIRLKEDGGSEREIRWIREDAALAEADGEPGNTAKLVKRVLLKRASRHWTRARPEELVDESSVVRVLAALGMRPDGTIEHFDEGALRRRPISMLLLPDDHPIWADLHTGAPIGQALRWAAEHAASAAAGTIQAACRRYEVEQRWVASFTHVGPDAEVLRGVPDFLVVLHALNELFDSAAVETPLSRLDLGPGGLTRLSDAIDFLMKTPRPPDGWRIRDVPKNEVALLQAPGYGRTTHSRLAWRLFAYAQDWRALRAGIDPTALDRNEVPSAARATLREGLDELASMFEPS